MHRLAKPAIALQAAALLTLLGAVAATANHQAGLPDASSFGQERAEAGGDNAADAVDVWVQQLLDDNHNSLLSTLADVVSRLEGNGADPEAVDAVNMVIEMLTTDDIGLNRAGDAVNGDNPDPAEHPGQP